MTTSAPAVASRSRTGRCRGLCCCCPMAEVQPIRRGGPYALVSCRRLIVPSTGRIVFADVKSSVSESTISGVNTFQMRMRKNVNKALDIVEKSSALTDAEKSRLRTALQRGEFDVQVIFAGNAKGTSRLVEKLTKSIRRVYREARVREPMRLDP